MICIVIDNSPVLKSKAGEHIFICLKNENNYHDYIMITFTTSVSHHIKHCIVGKIMG